MKYDREVKDGTKREDGDGCLWADRANTEINKGGRRDLDEDKFEG